MSQRRLTDDEHTEFVAFFKEGLKQYGATKADLASSLPEEKSAEDRFHENAGTLSFPDDPLANLSPEKMRRFVENALARPQRADIASRLIVRLARSERAVAWRQQNGGKNGIEKDPWAKKFVEFAEECKPFVTLEDALSFPSPPSFRVRGFINPYDVALFVDECLQDMGAWIQPNLREQIKRSLIKGIEQRAEHRANALKAWALQSEAFFDIRIREGVSHEDKVTGAVLSVKETCIRPVCFGEGDRAPLREGEREPEFHERLEAIMLEQLRLYATSKASKATG
jgi:hypothetical protein